MSEEECNKTITAFQGFITRPALVQDRLKRPPFLYLLHIYIEVKKASGFGDGLFDKEELTKDYYDNKSNPDIDKREVV